MTHGDIFLMDEISLADDSVLERLNSVLEPERSLVVAEKGGWGGDNTQVIAASGFELIATMKPGGDYGKKELSPALRNRFTEVCVPQITLREDRKQILDSMWGSNSEFYPMSDAILDFADRLADEVGDPSILGLRDIQVRPNIASPGSRPSYVMHRRGQISQMQSPAGIKAYRWQLYSYAPPLLVCAYLLSDAFSITLHTW